MGEFLIDFANFISKIGGIVLIPSGTFVFRGMLGEDVSGVDVQMCISTGSYGLFLLVVSLALRILYYGYLIKKETNNGSRVDQE